MNKNVVLLNHVNSNKGLFGFYSRSIIVIPATVVCLSISSSFLASPAYSSALKKLGNYFNEAGSKFANVVDVTDKNSDARRILRNLDITNSNSPACNTLRTGGDDVSAAAASSGNPKAMAAAAAIQVAKKICGKAAQGGSVNSDDAEIDMAVMYQTQLAIEQARLNNDFEKAKLLESSKLKIEQLQQQGQTDRVKIVQENLLAITLSNNQKEITLGEQNLRAVESNNWAIVESAKINADAAVRIETLKAEGRKAEAEALRDAVVKAAEADADARKAVSQNEKDAAIKVADIRYSALQEMTRSNNELDLRKAQLTNTVDILKVVQNFLGSDVIGNWFRLEAVKINAEKDITIAKLEIEKLERQTKPNPVPSDSVALLLTEWGWTRIDCRPGVVYITNISPTPVCVNATESMPSGQYTYDVASNQLQPLKPSLPQTIEEPSPTSDQEDSPDDDDIEGVEQIDGG